MNPIGTTEHSEARRMLDAFTSVGADRFHVTFTNIREEQTDFFKTAPCPRCATTWLDGLGAPQRSRPYTLPATDKEPEETVLAGENLILRPYTPPAVVLVQLDDLEQKQLERVRPAAFIILHTSPKERGYQAWLAVQGGDREFTSRLKRGTGADLSASGSVRMSGTGNYKRDYKADFPSVAIEEVHPGRAAWRGRAMTAVWRKRLHAAESAAAPIYLLLHSDWPFQARRRKLPTGSWKCRAKPRKTDSTTPSARQCARQRKWPRVRAAGTGRKLQSKGRAVAANSGQGR
jgi:hypothetical protein